MIHYICRFICYAALKLFFKLKVIGWENIPKKGGFIIASNHLSYLDPPAVGVAARRPLNYMARHDLFKNQFFSWVFHKCHAFPVKRDSADLSALKTALRVLKNGQGLLLFPEGSRQVNGFSDDPQPGIGFLAVKSNVPVIPSFVRGTDYALPKGAKKIKFTPISVTFGEPIHIERGMPYLDVTRLIMDNIRRLSC